MFSLVHKSFCCLCFLSGFLFPWQPLSFGQLSFLVPVLLHLWFSFWDSLAWYVLPWVAVRVAAMAAKAVSPLGTHVMCWYRLIFYQRCIFSVKLDSFAVLSWTLMMFHCQNCSLGRWGEQRCFINSFGVLRILALKRISEQGNKMCLLDFFFFSWQGFQLDISSFVSEYEKSIKRSPNELEICYCIELGLLRCLVWLRFVKPFHWRALCLVLCSA